MMFAHSNPSTHGNTTQPGEKSAFFLSIPQ
jgi:hypothetical protein